MENIEKYATISPIYISDPEATLYYDVGIISLRELI